MDQAINAQLTKTTSLEEAAKDLMSSNTTEFDEKMKELWKRRILIEDFIKNNEGLMQDSNDPSAPQTKLDNRF